MTNRRPVARPSRLSRSDKSNSSLANNSLLNPPISRNAAASQKMKDPAAQRFTRLMKFHVPVTNFATGYGPSSRTVLPPAITPPR